MVMDKMRRKHNCKEKTNCAACGAEEYWRLLRGMGTSNLNS
jgi:hypothetical protein